MLIISDTQTPVQSVESVVEVVKRINTALYKSMKENHELGYNMVWNHPVYSPAEIVSAFGSDGVALFQLSGGIQQILKNANPDYNVLNPNELYDITPNADGSVTVVAKNIPPRNLNETVPS